MSFGFEVIGAVVNLVSSLLASFVDDVHDEQPLLVFRQLELLHDDLIDQNRLLRELRNILRCSYK